MEEEKQKKNSIFARLPLRYKIYIFLFVGIFALIFLIVLFIYASLFDDFYFSSFNVDTPAICNIQIPIEEGSYRVSSLYGYRFVDVEGSSTFHRGIDLPAAKGTPVVAALGGEVSKVGKDPGSGYGLYVKIIHSNGDYTLYGHLSKTIVEEGQFVSQGEKVGEVGSTGVSSGNHLHFEYYSKEKDDRISLNQVFGYTDIEDCITYSGSKSSTFRNWCNRVPNQNSAFTNWSSIGKSAPPDRKMTEDQIQQFKSSCASSIGSPIGVSIKSDEYCAAMLNPVYISDPSSILNYGEPFTGNTLIGYPIRPISCDLELSGTSTSSDKYPGGGYYLNDRIVSNKAVSFKEYVMGVAYREMGGSAKPERIEAIKLQMIMLKSFLFSQTNKVKKYGTELWVPTDSDCFQVFRASWLNAPESAKKILEEAYKATENILLYRSESGEIVSAQYRDTLQNIMSDLAAQGLSYQQIIVSPRFQNWSVYGKKIYSPEYEEGPLEFGICDGGTYNGTFGDDN